MTDITFRVYVREDDGNLIDTEETFDISSFGGVYPAVGDKIISPWVMQGLERNKPQNREMYTILERVFNPRDMMDYVVLICDVKPVSEMDAVLLPPA